MNTEKDSWGEDEGARPSSLISVYKLASPDIHYDLQLRRELETANARARAELGPVPLDGLPVAVKRKPNLPSVAGARGDPAPDSSVMDPVIGDSDPPIFYDPRKAENMELRSLAMVAAVGAAALVSGPTYGGGHDSMSAAVPTAVAPNVPENFMAYSSTPLGEDVSCVVGSVADEDGMYARPFVYLTKTTGRKVHWAKYLNMSEDDYEGRATHCLSDGDGVYVLLQVDTQAPRSLSQTLLSVVKLRLADGLVEKETDVLVPETHANYSAWVKRRDGSFRRVNDELIVTGQYRYMDTEDELPFSVAVEP
jgi:hypothetical protein